MKNKAWNSREEDSKDAVPQSYVDYKFTWYQTEKFTTKAIALVDKKIDNMLQQRQIVNGLGKQIEDALYIKYTIRCFHYIDWMFISVNVTIYRNA